MFNNIMSLKSKIYVFVASAIIIFLLIYIFSEKPKEYKSCLVAYELNNDFLVIDGHNTVILTGNNNLSNCCCDKETHNICVCGEIK